MTDRIALLKQTPFFAELSPEELQGLAHDFVTREFKQGETIFYQGDLGRVLYLIAEGRVHIYVQNEEGQEKAVIWYGPGDVFGDMAVIDELPRSANAVALTDATLLLLSRENLRKHLHRSSQLALNYIRVLSNRLRYNTEQVYDLSFLDVPGRLARRLLDLVDRHGRTEGDGTRLINFPLTQSDLANLVGTTRESVNKTLSMFRKQGYIRMQQNYVVILDEAALRKMSM